MSETVRIEDIYEEILQGKRKRFPNGTWNYLSDSIRLVKYLIEEKLKWSDDDIRKNINADVFLRFKLSGMLNCVFEGSPYMALNKTYPGKFKPWELRFGPRNFWNMETGVQATRWLIEEKLNWSDMEIREKLDSYTFHMYGLSGMLQAVFEASAYLALNAAYPSKFRSWELNNTMRNMWNLQSGTDATKWLIEEKLKWSDEDVKGRLNAKTFEICGLSGMLQTVFEGSPFQALDAAYPSKFKQWELSCTPMKFWTKETANEAVRWMIETKLRWADTNIKSELTNKTFDAYGLGGMLNIFNSSPYGAIESAYPGRFKPTDFKHVPRGYKRGTE